MPTSGSGQSVDFQVIELKPDDGGGVHIRSPVAAGGHRAGTAGVPGLADSDPGPDPDPGPLDGLLSMPALALSDLPAPLRTELPGLIQVLALPLVIRGGQVAWRAGARSQADDLDAGRVVRAMTTATGADAHDLAAACRIRSSLLVTSTNSVLMAAAAAGAVAPLALLAHCQSAGRGRHQRAWHGRWGEAIQFSLLADSGRPLAQLSGLPLVAGVAVAQALVQLTGLPPGAGGIGLKWPNDLVHRQGKLAGLLVEAAAGPGRRADSTGGARAVIGLGLNWRASAALQAAAGQPVAALTGLPGLAGGDRAGVAGHILAHLLAGLVRFRRHGLAPFLAEYRAFDVLAGRPVRVVTGTGAAADGIAVGLAADGALRVRHGDHECSHHSAQVSVRPA